MSRVPLPFGSQHPLLGLPVPPRAYAPLTIGLPGLKAGTPTGFPRSAHTRRDRGGRPLNTPAGFRCLTWAFVGWREGSGTSIVRDGLMGTAPRSCDNAVGSDSGGRLLGVGGASSTSSARGVVRGVRSGAGGGHDKLPGVAEPPPLWNRSIIAAASSGLVAKTVSSPSPAARQRSGSHVAAAEAVAEANAIGFHQSELARWQELTSAERPTRLTGVAGPGSDGPIRPQ